MGNGILHILVDDRYIYSLSFIFRPNAFCKSSFKKRADLMIGILIVLHKLSTKHLELLLRIGFCMDSSPVSYEPHSRTGSSNFTVCHGFTGPNNDLITRHIPTRREIEQQTLKLHKILSLIPKPNHVTVCRSFRDGYVPKDFFPQIERNILSSIQNVFANFSTVHYDRHLLGGPQGWEAFRGVNLKRKKFAKIRTVRKSKKKKRRLGTR